MSHRLSRVVCLAAFFMLFASGLAVAAPTVAQRNEITKLRTEIIKAGNFYKQGRFDEAGDIIKMVQPKVEELSALNDPAINKLLEPIVAGLGKAHSLLEVEGIKLSPLKKVATADPTKPATPATPATPAVPKPATPAPIPASGQISFTSHVAPLFMQKCGRCHVNEARGRFKATNYEELMTGGQIGKVIFPGDADGSRLVEVIVSGDMPRGGAKVSAPELDLLKKWIAQGAKFDGTDPKATIASIVPAGTAPPPTPKLEVVKAAGNEGVSFSRDIAPLLVSTCMNCHGQRQPRARLSFTNFQNLLRGSENGLIVEPGKPAESLLVKKLKGTAGARMPLRAQPWTTEQIANVEKWILTGAKFDGDAANMPTERVAALAIARSATHETLATLRDADAANNWRLGFPNIASVKKSTDNFLILGNVPEPEIAEITTQAEAVMGKIATTFKAPAGKPMIKGKLTIFVLATRYDYSEFGNMVEKRGLPKEWRSHWMYDVVDSYVAMIKPDTPEVAQAMLAQQITGAYLASMGNAPRWFSEGAARVVTTKVTPQDRLVSQWQSQLPAALGAMKAADDFMTGKLPFDDNDIVSMSFVEYLMATPKWPGFLTQLRAGKDFTEAFTATFGGTPKQAAEAWAPRALAKANSAPRKK